MPGFDNMCLNTPDNTTFNIQDIQDRFNIVYKMLWYSNLSSVEIK